MKRVLAVDPGDVHIGLALSDETRSLAQPLEVLQHDSRQRDAERILEIAATHSADTIVVGVATTVDGNIGPQARKSLRLVEALRASRAFDVVTWDESGSTRASRGRGRRDPMIDARAAATILQEYLDAEAQR
jgi:putative Holliday junction resolvase